MLRRLGKRLAIPVLMLTCGTGFVAASIPLGPYPTATLTIGGTEQMVSGNWDNGPITVDFNGYIETIHYGQFSTPAALAAGLAAMFSRDYNAFGLYAKAGAKGNRDLPVITLQLANGHVFGPINIVAASSSFALTPAGFASSGSGADQGIVILQVTDTATNLPAIVATTNYGEGSTPATIAEGLALNARSPLVKVTAEDAHLFLESKPASGNFNYTYGLSFNSTQSGFPQGSFAGTPASGSLTNNTEASPISVYSYGITSYDGTGNVKSLSDSVMGSWTYDYDSLKRLADGAASSGTYAGISTCWTYDNFGNRLSQSVSSTPCNSSTPPPATFAASYGKNNRIDSVTSSPAVSIIYDDAGNVTNDGYNGYLYDEEGMLCAVQGPQGLVGYQYDANGSRIGKGTISSMSCDVTKNGYQPTTDYILDQGGGQMTEIAVGNGPPTWLHTNVMANGALLATFDALGLHFHLNDALGSRRVQTDPAGFPEQTCQSLPFGDQLYCTGSLTSPTQHHFTGKERDTESGLDYFGARYYGSATGRFMSPDPSGLVYADQSNPQSLNLYSYVLNNPLGFTDPTGLYCYWDDGSSDDDPKDGGASKKDCKSQGGTWTNALNPCNGADGCTTTTAKPMNQLEAQQTIEQAQYYANLQAQQPAQLSLAGRQFIQQVAKDTAGFPTVCSVGAYAQYGGGTGAFGASYDSSSGGKGYGKVRPMPGDIANQISPFSGSVKGDTSGHYSGSVTIRDPETRIGGSVSVDDQGTPTVSASWAPGPVEVGATAKLGTIGNPKCQPHP